MNAYFDAKLLHIACKTVAYCVNLFVLLHFKLYGSNLRAETARGGTNPASAARKTTYSGICCFAGRGCGVCFVPRNFDPQTADAGWTELADGVLDMGVC
jgi:hypothetical protein